MAKYPCLNILKIKCLVAKTSIAKKVVDSEISAVKFLIRIFQSRFVIYLDTKLVSSLTETSTNNV